MPEVCYNVADQVVIATKHEALSKEFTHLIMKP